MKRIMSLALVLMMLLNVALPTVNVFAEDGAAVVSTTEENAQNETTPGAATDTTAGAAEATEATGTTDATGATETSGETAEGASTEGAQTGAATDTSTKSTEGAQSTTPGANETAPSNAEDGAPIIAVNAPEYTFADGPVANNVTQFVTVKKVDVKAQDGSYVFKDGKLGPRKELSHWEEITFYYEWVVTPENMDNVKPNDYFVIPAPSPEKFIERGSQFDTEYDIKSESGTLGKFVVSEKGNIIAKFNNAIENRADIKKGYFEIYLEIKTTTENAKINLTETEKQPKGVLVFDFRVPPKQPIGSNPMTPQSDLLKSGNRNNYDKIPGLMWEIKTNLEQQRQYINTGSFTEKRNVWVEDEFPLNDAFYIYSRAPRILPYIYGINEDGSLSGSVALWNGSITQKVHYAEANEDYTTFVNRIKPLMKPFEVAIYPNEEVAKEQQKKLEELKKNKDQAGMEKIFNDHEKKLRVLTYLGDLTQDREYYTPSTLNYPDIKNYLDNLLNENRLTPARHKLMLQKYTTWDENKSEEQNRQEAKLKPILYYTIQFMTTHPVEGMVSNDARLKADGQTDLTYSAEASSVRAKGGATVDDYVTITINKKWTGKEGGDVTFTITGDDTEKVITNTTGADLTTQAKKPSEYTATLKAGEKIIRINKVLENKEIISKTNPKETEVVPIKYTLKEEMSDEDKANYKSDVKQRGNIFDVTNTNIEVTNLTVNKQWIKDEGKKAVKVNFYDSRDTEFKTPVYPLADDGITEATKEATLLNDTVTVKLPKYHRGTAYSGNEPVVYVVKEEKDTAYTPVATENDIAELENGQQTITLKNTVNIPVTVEKRWRERDVDAATKPEAVIEVKNAVTKDVVATLRTKEDKTEVFQLPKYDKDGAEITYIVEEQPLVGYRSTKLPVTNEPNKHVFANAKLQDLTITKEWKDSGDVGKRGDVTLVLYYKTDATGELFTRKYIEKFTNIVAEYTEGTEVKTIKPLDTNKVDGEVKFVLPLVAKEGKLTIKGLPQYDEAGTSLYFSVREEAMEGYLPCVTCLDGGTHNNKKLFNLESMKIVLEKQWVVGSEGQKKAVTFTLTNNGMNFAENIADVIAKANEGKVTKVAVKEGKNTTYYFTVAVAAPYQVELTVPKYDTTGKVLDYKVSEEKLDNFYAPVQVNNLTIKNVSDEKMIVKVKKNWVNSSLASVTVELRKDGNVVETVELNEAKGWMHEFTGLARFHEDGTAVVYTVTEKEVPNFKSEVKEDKENEFTVTNTYIPPIPPYVPEVPGGDSEKPTPPTPPTPPTTTEEIPGEPTPEGEPNKPTPNNPEKPNTPPTVPNVPGEPGEPEEEVPGDPIPQGKTELPKTDGIPAGMFMGLGLGLAALGLFFKKEK